MRLNIVSNSVQTRMSLNDAKNCWAQEPDHADNLPKNSRPVGTATLKTCRSALDSLWRGIMSLFWQTDTMATDVHNEDTGEQRNASSDNTLS